VLPYLVGLSARGHQITILSCEKPDRYEATGEAMHAFCQKHGLRWKPQRYHKKPPLLSSMYDAHLLLRAAVQLNKESPFQIVHCRSYIPGSVGLELKRRFGTEFLFDMRGFWPDERVDGNLWKLSNPVYRRVYSHFKKVETALLKGADHIISLTHQGKKQLLGREWLAPLNPLVTVIPCCVDFDHFQLISDSDRARARELLDIAQGARVVAYLGSVGTWYMLEEMLHFFMLYLKRHPEAVLLFLTPDARKTILEPAGRLGIPEDRLIIRSASREEVPVLMAAADLGLFFIKPVFSKIASSPTKMGELLALGLPVVANAGVGDVAEIVEATDCGIAIDRFDEVAFNKAIEKIDTLATAPEELRQRARPWFDLDGGIDRYDSVYQSLLEPRA
jgi:glycosyltransferase involved in cell wall biosynthesis